MKSLSWNVRGCNAPDKTHLIKRDLDQAKPYLVFLQETKVKISEVEGMRRKFCRWESEWEATEGASGGLDVFWKKEIVKGIVMQSERNWKWLKISSKELGFDFNVLVTFLMINLSPWSLC